MEIRNVFEADVRSKYVLLRDDFNVQIVDGEITETFRIDASMPTIKYLMENGARVVICSHLGRPKGEKDPELSLRCVAEYMNIPFISDCLDKSFLSNMKDGDVVLLENLRFYAGEEENDDEFAKKLSEGFDVYVNDAFAVSHRAAASTVGVTKYLPSFAGILLDKEIKNLTKVLHNPTHPLIAYIGGSKISSKIDVLKNIVKVADKMVIGGAMGTTFNYVLGLPVGNSLYEKDMIDTVKEIMSVADENNCEILLPIDKGVGQEFDKTALRENRMVDEIKEKDIIMDDGEKTTQRNIDLLKDAKTVIWNGPFGLAEWGELWGRSSFEFARALAKYTKSGDIESVVGGGDTVAVLDASGVLDDISYVSTGGGAFLEFIEGKTLPGIKVLEK